MSETQPMRPGAKRGSPKPTYVPTITAAPSPQRTALSPPLNVPSQLSSFKLLRRLGQGGMGAVYVAEDTQLQRRAAVKLMLPDMAADVTARERFLREARAAAAIKDDHVVTVYQVGEECDTPFIAMELLRGMPLDVYLERGPKLTIPAILRIGRETALGLAAAHEKGLVHRDIKPANLWLEAPKGRVKILDFGIARAVEKAAGTLTQEGLVVGTPEYMSPEQARGEALDGRSDLFSLGSVLYRLCAGRTPFAGPTVMAVLTSLAVDRHRAVRELNPDVPPALSHLIDALMRKKAVDRPATAREVAEEFKRIERSPHKGRYSPPATEAEIEIIDDDEPTEVIRPLRRRAHRNRKSQGGILVAVILGLMIVALLGANAAILAWKKHAAAKPPASVKEAPAASSPTIPKAIPSISSGNSQPAGPPQISPLLPPEDPRPGPNGPPPPPPHHPPLGPGGPKGGPGPRGPR